MVKGYKALNKVVSAQLKPFGIKECRCSDDYSYLYEKEIVTFKLTEDTIEDRYFLEFIKDRFNYVPKYPFIFSLLHEVGHHKTMEDICDSIYDFCETEKDRIETEMADTKDMRKCKKLEFQYFSLPDEILATNWAVQYSKTHPRTIEKMWNEIVNALQNFYLINGLYESEEN